MKSLIIALFIFPVCIQAHARLNLPPPADLLALAGHGRVELRKAVFELEKNIPEFTRLDEIDGYMRILPDLQALAIRYKLDEIYPRAIPRLGENMFSASMKWLDVRTVPLEQLLFYASYANFDLAYRFADSMESLLIQDQSQKALMIGAENMEALRLFFGKNLPNSASLDNNFRRIISDLAAKYIAQPAGVTNEQVDFWISKLSLGSTFGSVIELFANKIVQLKSTNAQDSHVYLARLILLKKRMDQFASELGATIFGSIGDQFSEVLTRMIALEVVFRDGEFETALESMIPKSVKLLTHNFTVPETPPSQKYIPEYTRVAKLLLDKLVALGLTQEAKDLTAYVQRILLPANAAALDIEGEYALVEPDGKRWRYSIIQARRNVYFSGIGAETLDSFKSFLNLTVDFINGGFLASEREPDNDSRHNFTSRFTIDEQGGIKVEDYQSFNTLKTFTGQKVGPFPKFDPIPKQPLITSGRWVGMIEFLDGAKSKCTLDITVFPGYSLGRLNLYHPDGKIKAFLDYGIGGKIIDNTFSLTTGQMYSTTWNHLRGAVVDGELTAVMIVGGRGVISKELKLKKL